MMTGRECYYLRSFRQLNFPPVLRFPWANQCLLRHHRSPRRHTFVPNSDAMTVQPFSVDAGSHRSCCLHRNDGDISDIVCTRPLVASLPHSRYCTLESIAWNASHLKKWWNQKCNSCHVVAHWFLKMKCCSCTFDWMWKQMVGNIFARFQSTIRTSNDAARHCFHSIWCLVRFSTHHNSQLWFFFFKYRPLDDFMWNNSVSYSPSASKLNETKLSLYRLRCDNICWTRKIKHWNWDLSKLNVDQLFSTRHGPTVKPSVCATDSIQVVLFTFFLAGGGI